MGMVSGFTGPGPENPFRSRTMGNTFRDFRVNKPSRSWVGSATGKKIPGRLKCQEKNKKKDRTPEHG